MIQVLQNYRVLYYNTLFIKMRNVFSMAFTLSQDFIKHVETGLPKGVRADKTVIDKLLAFKESEYKNDPARIHDIRGPYEVAYFHAHGKLPPQCYDIGDPIPWGLRVEESRSNILWQVLAGVIDAHPEFAAAYLQIALAQDLDHETYPIELRKLNKDWTNHLDHQMFNAGHVHSTMGATYNRVSCPACSLLTALAIQNKGMNEYIKDIIVLKNPQDRQKFLQEKGLLPLLDIEIPEIKKPELILRGDSI